MTNLLRIARLTSRFHLPLASLILIGLFLPASGVAAPKEKNTAPTGNRYLFVVENSSSMKKRDDALRQALFDLINGGVKGRMQAGDTFGVWTFNSEVNTQFPMQVWDPSSRLEIASKVNIFVKQLGYHKHANVEGMLADLEAVVTSVSDLTVILLTQGATDDFKGTPFDREIGTFYRQMGDSLQKSQEPFLTGLTAKGGRFIAYSVGSPSEPLTLPPPPPRPLVKKTNLGKGGDLAAKSGSSTTNAPARKVPSIIVTRESNEQDATNAAIAKLAATTQPAPSASTPPPTPSAVSTPSAAASSPAPTGPAVVAPSASAPTPHEAIPPTAVPANPTPSPTATANTGGPTTQAPIPAAAVSAIWSNWSTTVSTPGSFHPQASNTVHTVTTIPAAGSSPTALVQSTSVLTTTVVKATSPSPGVPRPVETVPTPVPAPAPAVIATAIPAPTPSAAPAPVSHPVSSGGTQSPSSVLIQPLASVLPSPIPVHARSSGSPSHPSNGPSAYPPSTTVGVIAPTANNGSSTKLVLAVALFMGVVGVWFGYWQRSRRAPEASYISRALPRKAAGSPRSPGR